MFWLGEIIENLHKKIAELELQVTPSTSLEVQEEIRKVATEVAKIIQEVEALCAKVVEQVSQTREPLINDEELDQVTK